MYTHAKETSAHADIKTYTLHNTIKTLKSDNNSNKKNVLRIVEMPGLDANIIFNSFGGSFFTVYHK